MFCGKFDKNNKNGGKKQVLTQHLMVMYECFTVISKEDNLALIKCGKALHCLKISFEVEKE